MVNLTQKLFTLTGLTLADALLGLSEILPARAYKKVSGVGANLTDINPAFLTMRLNEIFGPAGIGWKFDYDQADLSMVEKIRTKRSNGEQYTVTVCTIKKVTFQYRYVTESGDMFWSDPVVSNGGADNEIPEWAMRGALTNAIGGAASKINWQIGVYMGYVDHDNAAAQYAKQQAQRGATGSGQQKSSNERPAPEPKPEPAPKVEPKAEPVPEPKAEPAPAPKAEPKAEPEPEPKAEPVPAPGPAEPAASKAAVLVDESDPLYGKYSLVLPTTGLPSIIPQWIRGVPLAEAITDHSFGLGLLKFLTGKFASASGKYFTPETQEQRAIQEAAIAIWDRDGEKLAAEHEARQKAKK